MKTTLVPSGENSEKRANNTTQYLATRGLKTTSPSSRKTEWKSSKNNKKQGRNCLGQFLTEFNEGRSKTFYCTAATVLESGELESVLENARAKSKGLDIKAKSEVMHSLLNEVADNRNYLLKLRR